MYDQATPAGHGAGHSAGRGAGHGAARGAGRGAGLPIAPGRSRPEFLPLHPYFASPSPFVARRHSLGGTHAVSSSFPWILVSANDATDREKAQTDSAYQCDGVADDVQIQAALDVLPTGVVYLSSGTFNLAAAPTITTGNALRGVSKWLTFVKQTASTNLARLIDARGKSNLYFSDFTLDGNYANQTVWGYGLDISNNGTTQTNILMERIRFRNIGGEIGRAHV